MPNDQFRTCDVVIKRPHHKCGATDAHPKMTTTLAEVSERNPQPRWVCAKHWNKFPSIESVTGTLRHLLDVKSYEIKNGELVPLPKGDQYAQKETRRGRGAA